MCKELIHTDHPFTIHTLNCDTYLAITDRPTRTRIGGRQFGRIQWSAMSGHGGGSQGRRWQENRGEDEQRQAGSRSERRWFHGAFQSDGPHLYFNVEQ